MIRLALILFLSIFCTTFTVQPVLAADQPKAAVPEKAAEPIVPMSTVLQNLKMNGYDIVSKIELDNAVYNIEAMTPQGKQLSITMNAHSGEITSPKENPAPHVSLADAVKKVEGAGYHDISMIVFSGSKYTVKTLDPKNKKVKLKVDGNTGDISKAWF